LSPISNSPFDEEDRTSLADVDRLLAEVVRKQGELSGLVGKVLLQWPRPVMAAAMGPMARWPLPARQVRRQMQLTSP